MRFLRASFFANVTFVSVLLGAAACGGEHPSDPSLEDAGPDARDGASTPDAGLAATCRARADRFAQLVAQLGTSCDGPSDCVTLGGVPTYQFCNAYPSLSARIGGTPVSAASYASSQHKLELDAILEDWARDCAGKMEVCSYPNGVSCVWDAAQFPTTCENHVCSAVDDSCI